MGDDVVTEQMRGELASWDPSFTRHVLGQLWPLLRLYFRAEVRGLELVPPSGGVLLLGGVAVTAGQEIAAAALGTLTYQAAADANGVGYDSFTFQVRDDGGTTNGGLDTDLSANTLTFNVTAVNDAPVNTVPGAQTINEDGSLTLSSANGNAISVADVDDGGLAGAQVRVVREQVLGHAAHRTSATS